MHMTMSIRRTVLRLLAFGAAAVLALILLLSRDKAPPRYDPGAPRSVLGVPIGAVRNAVAARLDSVARPTWVTPDRWKRVRAVYAVWTNAPLWIEPEGIKERASALLTTLEEAPDHALRTDGYPLDSIRTLVNADALEANPTAERLADIDVLLTAAYVGYGTDMLMGQVDPRTISQAWHIPAPLAEVDSALIRTLQNPTIAQGLADMAPKDSAYTVLKSEYARYGQMVAAGGWARIPTAGKNRQTGVLARLRAERLPVDSVAGDAMTVIRLYQERHGLAETGKLDDRTVRSMNVPATERLQQIGSNLERQRWLPRSLGARYIHVNVPAFRLEAYDGGQKALEMRVVVGSEFEGRSTPVFSDSMATVVFRPYWNVTPNIAAKEFFPKYGTDLPEGFETWRENGELRIRQRPGLGNALGLVKFMFPNEFNIYLHDTPSKTLFAQADRAASHGCIRLQAPDKLAEFVLGWDNAAVKRAMTGNDNQTVVIPAKIPVYIVYLTAYVRDGHLHFSDDVYERDARLEVRMERRAGQ
jgi:murein L,D-transpeptidase YcbB/YkuD